MGWNIVLASQETKIWGIPCRFKPTTAKTVVSTFEEPESSTMVDMQFFET